VSLGVTDVRHGTRTLDVVIVAFECRALLRDCLIALRENPADRPMRTVVVDNASTDGTAEMLAREFEDVDLIEQRANLGFARATNVGVRSGDADYVLALNPDTRVTRGALDRLVAVLDGRPDVAAVGPRLELPDGRVDHAAARSFPTPLGTLGHFTGLARRSWARGRLAQYREVPDTAGPVDVLSGACMLLRRSALEAVGLFDERYWMYMEDIDLCYRLAKAGWKRWYEPDARVFHVKRGASGHLCSWRVTWSFHAGMWRFYRDHYASETPSLTNAAVYAGIVAKLGVAAVTSLLTRGPMHSAGT
jgi:GT2 family glycosyltransferase